MPILNLPNIIPSNSYYTTKMLVTSLRTMLNDYGGENLHTYNIRLWLNIGLTRAAAFIRRYAPQYYTVRWQAALQAEDYLGANLVYGTVQAPYRIVDLAEPVSWFPPNDQRGEKQWPSLITPNAVYQTVVPYKYISDVLAIQILHRYNTATPNFWMGLPHKVDMDKFAAVVSGLNDQWRQDFVWTMQGHKIYIWAGPEVLRDPSLGNQAITTNWYSDSQIELTVLRKPILDDLKDLDVVPPGTNDSNYEEYADCPDEAIGLMLQYAKEAALGALGRPEDPSLKQSTSLIEQSLISTLANVPGPTQ